MLGPEEQGYILRFGPSDRGSQGLRPGRLPEGVAL
jgi:hypothetical protein